MGKGEEERVVHGIEPRFLIFEPDKPATQLKKEALYHVPIYR